MAQWEKVLAAMMEEKNQLLYAVLLTSTHSHQINITKSLRKKTEEEQGKYLIPDPHVSAYPCRNTYILIKESKAVGI